LARLTCQHPAGIAMAPGVDSLNVAVTAGIVLHDLKFAQA
jgi:tRNA G18 (ribose-2'-O)-methylase SpoU